MPAKTLTQRLRSPKTDLPPTRRRPPAHLAIQTRTEALLEANAALLRARVDAALADVQDDPIEARVRLRALALGFRQDGYSLRQVGALLGVSPPHAKRLLLEAHAAGEYDETDVILKTAVAPASAQRLLQEVRDKNGNWRAARDTLKGLGKFRDFSEVKADVKETHSHLIVTIEAPAGTPLRALDPANVIGTPKVPALPDLDGEKVR